MNKTIYFISFMMMNVFFTSYMMNTKNIYIGPIDTLMIQRLAQEQGKEETEKKIKEHSFELWIPAIGNEHPFIITHRCYKSKNEKLEEEVFKKIEEVNAQPYHTNNISNQILITNNTHFIAIDECTVWKKEIDDSTQVNISAFFYNQTALLMVLKKIKAA